MSQDSDVSDASNSQTYSVEPPVEAPAPPSGASPSVSEPPAPPAGTAHSTVNAPGTSGSPASESAAPAPTDTSPTEAPTAPGAQAPAVGPQHQSQQLQPQQPAPVPRVKERNPVLYAAVDFLITGLGLMLQGRVLFGLLFLGINLILIPVIWVPVIGWILIFVVLLPVWIISMVMAFTTAKNWNRAHGIIS